MPPLLSVAMLGGLLCVGPATGARACLNPTASGGTLEATGGQTLEFGPAETLVVLLDATAIGARLAEGAIQPGGLRIRLNNLTVFDKPVAAARVFLDVPTEDQVVDGPGYVGSLAFFPSPSGSAYGESVGSFVVDLGEAATSLANGGIFAREGHRLTVIPIDRDGEPIGRIGLGSIELLG